MRLFASEVPYSSIVGSSIKVYDETGRLIAMLTILVPDPELDYKTVAEEVSEAMIWKLGKRPIAFRIKRLGNGWAYYEDESHAADAAMRASTNYQALYVRDGT